MKSTDHNFTIVRQKPGTDGKRSPGSRGSDVEVVDASLWPQAADGRASPSGIGISPESIEVSLLPKSRRLSPDLPVPGLGRPNLAYLQQRIARNPRDLETHVRRVYQAQALEDRVAVCGALTDLFAVLDRRGRPLRKRLLAMVLDQLEPSEREYFAGCLNQGFTRTTLPDGSLQSRLLSRPGGTRTIVVGRNEDKADPVSVARELVRRGDGAAACALLEGLLSTDPGNEELCSALLDLYEQGDLRERFFRTSAELLSRKVAHGDRWARLAARFANQAVSHE